MHPLGLSHGALTDCYPVLINPFQYPTIILTSKNSYKINPAAWPFKDSFPMVASISAQVIAHSINHFLVHLFLSSFFLFYLLLYYLLCYLRHIKLSFTYHTLLQ